MYSTKLVIELLCPAMGAAGCSLRAIRSRKAFLREEEGQLWPQRKAAELSMTDTSAFSSQFKARGICSIGYRALNGKEIKRLDTGG